MKRYLDIQGINKVRRIRVAILRMFEVGNDELAFAYNAASNNGRPYDPKLANDAEMEQRFRLYRLPHVDRGIAMILKVIGLQPNSPSYPAESQGALWYVHKRQRTLPCHAAV